MALLGRLNFASHFIPNCKCQVNPLWQLLKGSGGGFWPQDHTDTLNQLAELISKQIYLGLIDTTYPARLHMSVGDTQC